MQEQQKVESTVRAAQKLFGLIDAAQPAGHGAAAAVLSHLADLYAAALQLQWPSEAEGEALQAQYAVRDTERAAVAERVSAIFGDRVTYWMQFDPTLPRQSGEGPVRGHLGEDLSDVFAGVMPAVRAWEAKADIALAEIAWGLRATPFESDWGVHAAHALHALHWIAFFDAPGH